MTRSLIVEGLKDAVRHVRGDKSRSSSYTIYVEDPLDVRAIRHRFGLTQVQFAQKYGFKLSSVRNWEQGRRQPSGAYQNLLKLIDQIPDQVEKVLSGGPGMAAA
jgi:putative transcriptional regulator